MAGFFTDAAIATMYSQAYYVNNDYTRFKIHSGDPGLVGADNIITMYNPLVDNDDPSLRVDTPITFAGANTIKKFTMSGHDLVIGVDNYPFTTTFLDNHVFVLGPVTITHVGVWRKHIYSGNTTYHYMHATELITPVIIPEGGCSLAIKGDENTVLRSGF